MSVITRIRKNGITYRISAVDFEDALAQAKTAATSASAYFAQIQATANEAAANVQSAAALLNIANKVCGFDKAEEFETGVDYMENALVIYEDKFYRFTQFHDGSNPWLGTDVVETSLYEEVQRMMGFDVEHVTVHLYASDGAVTMVGRSITVTDLTTSTTIQTSAADANAEIKFDVQKGHDYRIVYPSVTGYNGIANQTYRASLSSRPIIATYQKTPTVQHTHVSAAIFTGNASYNHNVESLVGQPVTCEYDGTTYTEHFDVNAKCTFDIPVGKSYTIVAPYISDMSIRTNTFTGTAIAGDSYIIANYVQNVVGIRGISSDGTLYTADEILELADKSVIVGIVVNTPALQAAMHDTDTQGCGFIIPLTISQGNNIAWANQNREFDQTILPYLNSSQASVDYQGWLNTDKIKKIAASLNQGGAGVTIPAVTWCEDSSRHLTIGGVEKVGYLGSAGQWVQVVSNYTAIKEIANAAGKTIPAWNTSGRWWSSSQNSATYAWRLDNGSLNYYGKYTGYSVLPFFDF